MTRQHIRSNRIREALPRIRILPYRQGSRSARALADALGGRVLRLEGSTFRPRRGDLIINWGNTSWIPTTPNEADVRVLNRPYKVTRVSNKLNFFNLMRENNSEIIPEFWTRREDIPVGAYPVVCRTVLAGYSGAGIVIANSVDELVPASLYTKYIKKEQEYRVHCGLQQDGSVGVIVVQRKARNTDVENPNWQVRNHSNGFVFVRGGFVAPPMVIDAAKRSLAATGLDFGGVDVIWNSHQQRAYVLEINSACGIENTTVEDYANYFRRLI